MRLLDLVETMDEVPRHVVDPLTRAETILCSIFDVAEAVILGLGCYETVLLWEYLDVMRSSTRALNCTSTINLPSTFQKGYADSVVILPVACLLHNRAYCLQEVPNLPL